MGIDLMVRYRFVNVSSRSVDNVVPVGEDRGGSLYLTLDPGGAIVRFKNNQFTNLGSSFGADGMVETEQGELWLTSRRGIFRIPPGGLGSEHAGGRAGDEPLDYASFGGADGLTSTRSTVGIPNSTLSRDGRLWIATTQGLAMFDLPRLPRSARKPAIYMEEITVGRNVQMPTQQLLLPPDTHHIELSFD